MSSQRCRAGRLSWRCIPLRRKTAQPPLPTPSAPRSAPIHQTVTRGLGLRCVGCGGQLRMLSVAYNNLGVALFGLGLETDLPALRLLAERAVATAELAAVAPGTVSSRTRLAHRPRLNAFRAAGGDLPTSHAAVFRDNAAVINERTGRQAPPRCVLPALAFGQPSAALTVRGDVQRQATRAAADQTLRLELLNQPAVDAEQQPRVLNEPRRRCISKTWRSAL